MRLNRSEPSVDAGSHSSARGERSSIAATFGQEGSPARPLLPVLGGGDPAVQPSQVLRLQRTIGNRATERLLRKRDFGMEARPSAGLIVQRAIDQQGFESRLGANRQLKEALKKLTKNKHYQSLLRRIGRYNKKESLSKLDEIRQALIKLSAQDTSPFVGAFDFLNEEIKRETQKFTSSVGSQPSGNLPPLRKEPPPLREEPPPLRGEYVPSFGQFQSGITAPSPKRSFQPLVISPQNEGLESIFGPNTNSGLRTPPPLREDQPFFPSFHRGMRTPPPLDLEEGFTPFGQTTNSGLRTPPPLREEQPFFPPFHRGMRTPPPLDFEEEFTSFGPNTKSGLRTPPPLELEKGFGFLPFEEPEWRKEPKSNRNVPPLREEKLEQPILPYEEQVAQGFSQRTGQIFLKLWRTAPNPARERMRQLFSVEPDAKNLSGLEYVLEALDPEHRLEHRMGLEQYAETWAKDPTEEYFFDWLGKLGEKLPEMGTVDYFDEETRARYELRLGRRIVYQQDKKALEGNNIYAMSRDKKFYASQGGSGEKGVVHHSSFLSGSAVGGAGHMTFKSPGKLGEIDVNSGHYKPGPRQMINALDALDQSGVELDGVTVRPNLSGETFKALDWLLEMRQFRY